MKDISRWRNRPPADTEAIDREYLDFDHTEEIELRYYFNVLLKHRRLLVLVFFAVFVVGAYLSVTATPLYQASSILKIEPQNPSVTGVAEMVRLSESGPYDYYQTQFKLLESNTLAAKVINELQLESNQIFTNADVKTSNPVDRMKSWFFGQLNFAASLISVKKPEASQGDPESAAVAGNAEALIKGPAVAPWLIAHYRDNLKIKPIVGTRLVEIGFSTTHPGLSQRLADAHARAFIQLSRENRFALTNEARDFLDGKNVELKQKLERSEDALNRFRQAHGVVSMEKGENVVVERLVELNRQLTTARGQRIEAETLYKVVENKSTQSISQVVSQGLVPNLRSNLLVLEAEQVKLSSIFKPDHPRMVELNQQISEIKRSVSAEINNVVRGIEASFFAARSKEQALQAEALKQQGAALNLKHVGVEYAVLEEEVKVNRTLYESVLKRLNETNISNDLAVSNMQLTQNAERPTGPFTPNTPIDLLISGLMGLCLGVGVVFFREFLDSSLSTPQRVWRAVALSTFGVVPDLAALNRKFPCFPNGALRKFLPRSFALAKQETINASKELIVSHYPLSILGESYRTIRTALLFSQPEKPPKVILLTSPAPAEGKTLTTVNLAIALAQDGHKVLVIDADLRKGCCDARLGITNHSGLSNVLTGNLSLEEAIRTTSISGLSLLSGGIRPPNPTDLLGTSKMRQILSEVRESFNFVLIDSPPAMAVSDAAVLSVMCDGVLLVFHGQKTTTTSARRTIERLDAVRAPFLGVILNSIDLGNPEYAYYRHYYGSDYHPDEALEAKDGGETIIETSTNHSPDMEISPEKLGTGPVPRDFFDDMTDDRRGEEFHRSIQGQLKGYGHTDRCMKEISPRELKQGNVPREFFDHMTFKLGEAVGFMAPVIIRDHVARLGESLESFPKTRLKELVEQICVEILSQKLKRDFQQTMSSEIRSL